MSPGSVTRLKGLSNEVILRCSDTPSAPAGEFAVEIVDENNSEPIFRCPVKIGEQTPVTLLGNNHMVNGIVRLCREDRNSYLITVATDDLSAEPFEPVHFRDAGALVVDDFLTEEEEARILEGL